MTPEITKTEDKAAKTGGRPVWIFFGFLTVFVYFFGLYFPFAGPDEPRYAQVAREMLESGDWMTPTLGGSNWFEKPPLLYWLEIISYRSFGVSEFAARFGPAVFGLAIIVSLWILGGYVKTKAQGFANYLALIAASSLGLIAFSHAASSDIIITFPITAALVSFYIWLSKSGNDRGKPKVKAQLQLVLFYAFCGIGLLAKGLIGIVFPFTTVGLFYLLSRRLPSRTLVISLCWGTLLALAIGSIWYLPMYQRHGWKFIDEFFVQHHFQRFTSNKYQHPQPFYFFFWILPLMMLPWLPFFLASIWNGVKQLLHRKDKKDAKDIKNTSEASNSLFLFSVTWIIVPLIFFSFSGSKLPGYILPALPGVIILTSIFIFDHVRNNNKWRNAILLTAASTFGVAILLLAFAVPRFAEADSVKTLMQAASERGFVTNQVLTLHMISQSAEFYAAGRLLRDTDGKQRRFEVIDEIAKEIKAEDGRIILVLVPVQYVSQLTESANLMAEVLKDNGEVAIVVVSLR